MASAAGPDVDAVYLILKRWAEAEQVRTYTDLSNDYLAGTGAWFEPHRSWDRPLGEVNRRLAEHDAPAISALVVLMDQREPGRAFWGCAPNVPPRPRSDVERVAVWARIVDDVHAFDWPVALPA
jgi:hypothetical protein